MTAPTPCPLLVVSGTGTHIGKTYVAASLVASAGRLARVAGVKPIESGGAGDGEELGRVSTFHVTRFPPPYLLKEAVSPHLAARRAGIVISLDVVVDWTARVRAQADAVLLELPGGLFSPLTDDLTNADLVRKLPASRLVLVAPDRLGVLHDVTATVRAAHAATVNVDGLILSAPEVADTSTGTNAAELRRLADLPPVLAALARDERPRDDVLARLGWPR
jgi:dethiobiotin synthetase